MTPRIELCWLDGTGKLLRNGTIETTPQSAPTPLRGLTQPSDQSRGGLAVNATPNEEWRPIPGFPRHRVSRNGRVWSEAKGRELRPSSNNGYLRINFGKGQRMYVHQAVLLAFVGCPEDGMEVRHLNGNPLDNRVENLSWGTSLENKLDIVRHGHHQNAKKTTCPRLHPYDYTYPDGRRGCLRCIRDGKRARRMAGRRD